MVASVWKPLIVFKCFERFPFNGVSNLHISHLYNISFYYLINIDFKGVHVGLALATSISAYINFYYLFRNAFKTKILIIDKSVLNILLKSILASIIMTILILCFDLDVNSWVNLNFLERIKNLFIIVSSSAIIYLAILYVLKISPKNIK